MTQDTETERWEARARAAEATVASIQAAVDEIANAAERQRARRDEPLGQAYLHRATALTAAVRSLRAALSAGASR